MSTRSNMQDEFSAETEQRPAEKDEPPHANGDRMTADLDLLIREAEKIRLGHMQRYNFRNNAMLTLNLTILFLCAAAYGWFLIYEIDVMRALAILCVAAVLPLFIYQWAKAPLRQYRSAFKRQLMPELARALDGFQYSPGRGIPAGLLRHSGLFPAFRIYEAEDFFSRAHKNSKIMFCEARIRQGKDQNPPMFRGILALFEVNGEPFQGHSIISSADIDLPETLTTAKSRLRPANIEASAPAGRRFKLLTDTPEHAQSLIDADLLRELTEASAIFGDAPIALSFFHRKYALLCLQTPEDLFEPSNIKIAVYRDSRIRQLQSEITKIIEILDIIHLYQSGQENGIKKSA